MISTMFCQSCGMPIDSDELKGTEKDGAPSNEYCKYCYENGQFADAGITFDEMRKNVIQQMEKEKIPADIIESTVLRLSSLKRWREHTLSNS